MMATTTVKDALDYFGASGFASVLHEDVTRSDDFFGASGHPATSTGDGLTDTGVYDILLGCLVQHDHDGSEGPLYDTLLCAFVNHTVTLPQPEVDEFLGVPVFHSHAST